MAAKSQTQPARQKRAEIDTSRQPDSPTPNTEDTAQYVGVDTGYHDYKLVLDSLVYKQPSYLLPIHVDALQDDVTSGMVTYVGGDAPNLIGRSWLVGDTAYKHDPLACRLPSEDPAGKVQDGLELLLGAISTFPYKDTWNLIIAASIHDHKLYRDDLKKRLSGCHVIKFNGSDKTTKVTLHCIIVAAEGAAVPLYLGDTGKQVITIDLGSQTTAANVIAEDGKLKHRFIYSEGVGKLLAVISNSLEIKKIHGKPGDIAQIRCGIESGTFRYGKGSDVYNFADVYKRELELWMSTVVRKAYSACNKWMASTDKTIAIGGGVCLPFVEDTLRIAGFEPATDPAMVNAHSLKYLAIALSGGDD